MKRIVALVIVGFLVWLPQVRAQQGPDDLYLKIYYAVKEGDSLAQKDQPAQALAKYKEAQGALQAFQKGYPEWNSEVVKFRLNYLASKIAALAPQAVPPASKPAPGRLATAAGPPEKPAPKASALEIRIGALQAQLSQLRADNGQLQDKLKEALAAQPAAVNPAELAKAQEEIRQLQKQNALLDTSMAQQQPRPASATASNALTQASQTAVEAQLAAAQQALAKDNAALTRLNLENQALQARLKGAPSRPTAQASLAVENERLKAEVSRLSAAASAPQPAPKPDLERQLSQAVAQIAMLQSDKAILRQQNGSLEARVKRLSGRRRRGAASNLEAQLADLQARLDAYEAHAVPYTPEELAVLKNPAQNLAASNAVRLTSHRPSPKTAALLADAGRLFSAGQYDKAEAEYIRVVHEDDSNPTALANLAVIQMQRKELAKAQKNIERAVTLAPQDAYSLWVLGQLRFRQARYDEALTVLSKAAKLDPKDAQVQNLLGIVLGQKGMREAAEAAFRKAIELKPDFGEAHNNLAVVYLSEKPPLTALARWHYQKALGAGHPRNPALEKMLAAAEAQK
jgi:Flp pilus assembly protein TadD